jgi:hypothetical protein
MNTTAMAGLIELAFMRVSLFSLRVMQLEVELFCAIVVLLVGSLYDFV